MRILFLCLLCLLQIAPVYAQDAAPLFDYTAFREIPIVQEGRVKPLEGFARTYLLAFYGKASVGDMSAIAWLAELLFEPEKANKRAIFNIADPDVAAALHLPWRVAHDYTFDELSPAFAANGATVKAINDMDDAQRTPSQRHLLELYSKTAAYALISKSLSLALPRFRITGETLAKNLGLPRDTDLSFLDLVPHENEIFANADRLKSKKPQELTPEEREQAFLALDYLQLSEHQQSTIFRIIPPLWAADNGDWLSPWASLYEGHGSPQSAAYIAQWNKMAVAYAHGDANTLKQASVAARDEAYRLAGLNASEFRQKLEVFYLRGDLIEKALALYGLGFVMLMAGLLMQDKRFPTAAFGLVALGAVIHAAAIAARIIIMHRPPVATLYETTLFVSFIAVFLSLLFERKRRDNAALFTGSLIGAVLLFISTRYAADGDTMEMLVAVLNTNFWLATHVVAVTIGYGCSLVAGTLGHLYLIRRWTYPKDTKALASLMNAMLAVTLIAVFFATLGTILGGIWADQSWGRFWGWDPKENGALLIVLWLLWQLHGRIANVLSPLNFASTMVLTNVVVALSWFGVNLLGVGLHSYGFTTNIAANLGAFCAAEITFLAAMRILLRSKKNKRDSGQNSH